MAKRNEALLQVVQFLIDAYKNRQEMDKKLMSMSPDQQQEVIARIDYMQSIQYEFSVGEISKRIPSLTYSSIFYALSGSNDLAIKKKVQPEPLMRMGIFTNYTTKPPKYRYEPTILVHRPMPASNIVMTPPTQHNVIDTIVETVATPMPPVVEKVIERVEVPVEKVIVEPCKRAHLPIALYDPLMAKLSNRMGTWRFDDGWHIVEKFLDSESNEEPQKIVGWVGVTQQELELLKKSFPRKDWFTDGKPIKVTPPSE
jgi:hypothetical protein